MSVYLRALLVLAVVKYATTSIFDESERNGQWPVGRLSQRSNDKAIEKNFETVTIKVGREAVLPCFINNLGSYKVVWSKNGDVLSYGVEKINMDRRLKIQHRYVSEWHLVIDNVATDDEGDYICKATGGFYKTIRLEVLMPPTIDDLNSVPAGTINLKEDSSIALKCHAEGKPTPSVKWYRWKSNEESPVKQELAETGFEVTLNRISRDDPNMYECIATNSVPPATSRIFNIEIHFLPVVELNIIDSRIDSFSMDCQINANPLESVTWYKNGHILINNYNHESPIEIDNYSIVPETYIDNRYKHSLALLVQNPAKKDFSEYQCCAKNAYGQVCGSLNMSLHKLVTKEPEWITKPSTKKFNRFNFGLMNSNILNGIRLTTLEAPRAIFKNEKENKTAHADGMVGIEIDDKRRHYPAENFLSLDSNSAASKASFLFSITFLVTIYQLI